MRLRAIVGAGLVLLGMFLLFYRGDTIGVANIFRYFWPSIFIMPLGVFFHWLYYSVLEKKDPGVLVPGGILLVVGIVCQISMLFDAWVFMWPGFIFAVAVGLFELYWFGDRSKWLLVPIFVLSGVSFLFFAVFSLGTFFNRFMGQPIIAVALVFIGLVLLFVQKRRV